MRKLVLLVLCIVIWSCGEDEEIDSGTNSNNPITPSIPTLISPSNNSTITVIGDEEVYFTWNPSTGDFHPFNKYSIEVDEEPNFQSPYVQPTNTNEAVFYLPNSNIYYYWRVRSIGQNGESNGYSEIWTFYLENGNAPTPPTLIFPQNETECANDFLTFQWNESTDPNNDPIEYTLLVSTDPSFSNNVDSYNTSSTDYTLSLPESTALYWKVEASNGTQTSVSQGWSLYVQGQGANNTVPQIEYIYPEDDAVISDQSPQLQWLASDNETSDNNLSYKVYFSEVGEDLELVYEDTNISSYEVSGLDFGTTYQWSIWVTDEDGATNVGEVYRFTVD